jgi:hypothetical protein
MQIKEKVALDLRECETIHFTGETEKLSALNVPEIAPRLGIYRFLPNPF